MPFIILFDDQFAEEFEALPEDVREQIASYAVLLRAEGHQLKRPYADTLSGSSFANMKELRPTVNKVEWRVAFAFDAKQRGILLAASAKGGKKDAVIYKRLIATADKRFAAHQAKLKPKGK